ncbi:hypothetical protein NDU88_003324 [Pleurodeles waltl]|uniref:Uncharacterized protein n=1 Tax=Pleurodeles waltl TaxID=8319 RepID=A0AAV7LGR3_PLEWA|nr:hypothetical protein NDU88_003324 [Pleurodeles waltl]
MRGERAKGPDEAYAQVRDRGASVLDPGNLTECFSTWAYICHAARFPTAKEASVLHRYQRIKRQSPIAPQGRRREQLCEKCHTQSGQETHHSAAQRGLRIQTERWRVDAG